MGGQSIYNFSPDMFSLYGPENIVFGFCYNFCFSSQAIAHLIETIKEVRLGCVGHPDSQSMILMGGFNLAPELC